MSWVSIVRLVSLASATVFAIIAMGVSAHLTNFSTTFLGVYFEFAALSIAAAVLTIFTLPVMLIIDLKRKGAFTSKILVEIVWIFVLWVLWLAVGANAADANIRVFTTGCGYINPDVDMACKEFSVIEAFGFLTWIILLGYNVLLLTLSVIAATRGNPVWGFSVREANFFQRGTTTTAAPTIPEKTDFAPQIQQQQPAGGSYPQQTYQAPSLSYPVQQQQPHPAQQPSPYPQV